MFQVGYFFLFDILLTNEMTIRKTKERREKLEWEKRGKRQKEEKTRYRLIIRAAPVGVEYPPENRQGEDSGFFTEEKRIREGIVHPKGIVVERRDTRIHSVHCGFIVVSTFSSTLAGAATRAIDCLSASFRCFHLFRHF